MTSTGEQHSFTTTVERVRDFEFLVRFDKEHYAPLTIDEPEPLGRDSEPDASRILSAAVGDCLSASLLFCLQRSKLGVKHIRAEVTTTTSRNNEGRWRLSHLTVNIFVATEEPDEKRLKRCIEIFENYCVVTASVRQGIPVDVSVIPIDT
ncbi:MAG: OsmC family protein [Promethearchaeota archaeon]